MNVVMQVKVKKVKEAYIYDLYSDYYELLICRRSSMGPVNEGSHSFTYHPPTRFVKT